MHVVLDNLSTHTTGTLNDPLGCDAEQDRA